MEKKPPTRDDVPWTKRQEIPDPQILDAADQYAQAFKALAEASDVLLPLMNVASMAIELYLKALSAEMIYVEDDLMSEVSHIYAAPAIAGNQGHGLVGLLNAMPDDVHAALLAAYDAEAEPLWHTDLESVLQGLEGILTSSRYAFEYGTDITKYNLGHLAGLVGFLARFVKTLPPTDRIVWKKSGIPTHCT